MSALPQIQNPEQTSIISLAWHLRNWDKELLCCTKLINPYCEPRIVAVVDVGSNSLKLTIYDKRESPPAIVAKSDEVCGLAEDMIPNDPAAKFNDKAIELVPRHRGFDGLVLDWVKAGKCVLVDF